MELIKKEKHSTFAIGSFHSKHQQGNVEEIFNCNWGVIKMIKCNTQTLVHLTNKKKLENPEVKSPVEEKSQGKINCGENGKIHISVCSAKSGTLAYY